MKRSLLIWALVGSAFFMQGGCKSLSQEETVQAVTNATAYSRYGNEIVALIRVLFGPDEEKILIKAKEGDPAVRSLENIVVKRLQSEGYAVVHLLPADEMQKESKKISHDGTEIALNLIPYQGSQYSEISLELNGERYSRLFSNKLRDPAPVSHWIKRTASE